APSSQRDPRIPQACIMFALLGIVCLLRQRGTPGGRFPCGLALRPHLVLSISTSSPSRSRYSEMRRPFRGNRGQCRIACGAGGAPSPFRIPSTWPRLPDGGPSFAPDVRNNLGTSEFPRCGRPLLLQRRALSPAEPGGAFSLRHVHDRGRTHSPLCGLGLSSGRFCRCLPRGFCCALHPLYHPLSELFCLIS